jgi:hypothetical protein
MADKPKAYRATEAVYVNGVLYKAGEVFVTADPKGSTWEPVDGVEKAAIEAGKEIKDDVDYSALSASELRATAAALGVNLGDAKSRDDILRVLAARDDPTR